MVTPTGEHFEIAAGGYRAVVTESGALRLLEYDGQPLIDGFAESELPTGGRGQLLMPWPNRIEDGRYEFGGQVHQLPLTEVGHANASHGLVRWATWTVEEHSANAASLSHRLLARSGYPWTLDLNVVYDLSADGLTVTQTATNLSPTPAPYACGAHPYLLAGAGPVDTWELTLPAATRLLTDDRMLPRSRESVDGTPYDFRIARPVRETVFDHAFTDLDRDEQGVATVVLRHAARPGAVALWVDRSLGWLQVYSADGAGPSARRSLAVEPMTAPANAFRTGEDLTILAPAGDPEDHAAAVWGIRALD